MAAGTDYTQRLQVVQSETKIIAARRDQFIRDAAVETEKVRTAYEQLKALGVIDDASQRLSAEELEALRAKSQADMDTTLTATEAKVAQSKRLVAEYDAIPA